jgi:hypothetical protein
MEAWGWWDPAAGKGIYHVLARCGCTQPHVMSRMVFEEEIRLANFDLFDLLERTFRHVLDAPQHGEIAPVEVPR